MDKMFLLFGLSLASHWLSRRRRHKRAGALKSHLYIGEVFTTLVLVGWGELKRAHKKVCLIWCTSRVIFTEETLALVGRVWSGWGGLKRAHKRSSYIQTSGGISVQQKRACGAFEPIVEILVFSTGVNIWLLVILGPMFGLIKCVLILYSFCKGHTMNLGFGSIRNPAHKTALERQSILVGQKMGGAGGRCLPKHRLRPRTSLGSLKKVTICCQQPTTCLHWHHKKTTFHTDSPNVSPAKTIPDQIRRRSLSFPRACLDRPALTEQQSACTVSAPTGRH